MHREARQMDKTYHTFVSSSKTYHQYYVCFNVNHFSLSFVITERNVPCFSKSATKGGKIVHIIENLLQFFIFGLRVH